MFDHARLLASLLDQSQPLLALLNLAGAGLQASPRKNARGHRMRPLIRHPGRARATPTPASVPLTSPAQTDWSARCAADRASPYPHFRPSVAGEPAH